MHIESRRIIVIIVYKEIHIITIITTYITIIRLWLNNNVCQHQITISTTQWIPYVVQQTWRHGWELWFGMSIRFTQKKRKIKNKKLSTLEEEEAKHSDTNKLILV